MLLSYLILYLDRNLNQGSENIPWNHMDLSSICVGKPERYL
jgi:hypothetical protein